MTAAATLTIAAVAKARFHTLLDGEGIRFWAISDADYLVESLIIFTKLLHVL